MGSNRAEPTGADYCRLGERDRDKMSWLAPPSAGQSPNISVASGTGWDTLGEEGLSCVDAN